MCGARTREREQEHKRHQHDAQQEVRLRRTVEQAQRSAVCSALTIPWASTLLASSAGALSPAVVDDIQRRRGITNLLLLDGICGEADEARSGAACAPPAEQQPPQVGEGEGEQQHEERNRQMCVAVAHRVESILVLEDDTLEAAHGTRALELSELLSREIPRLGAGHAPRHNCVHDLHGQVEGTEAAAARPKRCAELAARAPQRSVGVLLVKDLEGESDCLGILRHRRRVTAARLGHPYARREYAKEAREPTLQCGLSGEGRGDSTAHQGRLAADACVGSQALTPVLRIC